MIAERAGQPDAVDLVDAHVVHQQPDARVQRRLGELNRAYVVLGDLQWRRSSIHRVGKGAPGLHDPIAARGECAVHHPVLADDAGEIHFGDDFDDPRAADAGYTRAGDGLVEAGLIRPQIGAYDLELRFECRGIDAHALDRPGSRALTQLICAPSKAGPVGLEQASSRSRLPRTISALVPTSTSSVSFSERSGRSARIMAAASAPT